MFKLHSCVEQIVSPLGMLIFTGFVVGLTFVTGAPVMTKYPVVPESLIAMPLGMGIYDAALFAYCVLAAWLYLESAVAWLLLAVFDVMIVTSSPLSSCVVLLGVGVS